MTVRLCSPQSETRRGGVKRRRNLGVWVALFFFLVWSFSTHSHVGSFNDRSRMAAIESLVERGTWIIDESPFSRTVDRIFVDGHFYSDKPPVLAFIASGVYAVLHRGFGLSLDAGWCDLDESPCHCRAFCDDSPDWAYYLLTLTLIGVPSALMLALFYHMTGLFGLGNPAAILLTAALGLATQVFPYSTVFNSHIPAAACLLAGFYALLRARRPLGFPKPQGSPAGRWLFFAGLLTALAFTFDLGVGLFFVAFFGYALWGHRRHAWPYILGGLLPIAWMVFLDYQIVGTPLPPYMYTQGYDYPGSRFPQTIAGNRSPENVLIYGLRLLLGDHGLFAFNPVLLWAGVALVRYSLFAIRHSSVVKEPLLRWRNPFLSQSAVVRFAILVGLTSSLFALYFILFTDNFGGAAYGPRWYTVFIPLFFLFVAVEWGSRACSVSEVAKPGFWIRWFLFLALTCISFLNSYQGALNPWRATIPLLRLEYALPGWREPVDAALSGVAFEEIEPDILATFATRRVDKRWFDARSCLVIPRDPVWLFVGPDTPLDPALVGALPAPALRAQQTLGVSETPRVSGGSLACYVDLRPAWDVYREQVVTSAWTSPVLIPSDSDPLTSISLPADFSGQFAFLGYEWLSGEPRAGEEVTLITAWRVEDRPEPPLAIFVQILDPHCRVARQFDGLGDNPDGLWPGDVLLHVHRFTIAPDAPPGHYWLQLGLYNPDTMARLPLTGLESDRLLLTRVEVMNNDR